MLIRHEHLPHQDSLPSSPAATTGNVGSANQLVTSSTHARPEDTAVSQAMHLTTEFHESGHSCQGCSLLKENESISHSVVSRWSSTKHEIKCAVDTMGSVGWWL